MNPNEEHILATHDAAAALHTYNNSAQNNLDGKGKAEWGVVPYGMRGRVPKLSW